MICKKCGYRIKAGSKFCKNCGELVEKPGGSNAVKPKTFRQEMKEITNFLNKHFPYYGEMILLFGSGIFVYNFFNLISSLSV